MKKFIKKFKPFAIGVLFLNLLILIIGSFAIGILWTLLILIPLNIALIVAGEKAKKKYLVQYDIKQNGVIISE